MSDWIHGDASRDGSSDNGWFFGHFMEGCDLQRTSTQVELKWSKHAKGESQTRWEHAPAESMTILISGSMLLTFEDGSAHLSRPGNYAKWAADVAHTWEATSDDTTVLTVRWPSSPRNRTS